MYNKTTPPLIPGGLIAKAISYYIRGVNTYPYLFEGGLR